MHGLPVLTTNAGALPEQLGQRAETDSSPLAGVLVDADDDDATTIERFSRELVRLLVESDWRRTLAEQSRRLGQLVPHHSDALAALPTELDRAEPWPAERPRPPDPSAALAVQNLLAESARYFDLAAVSRRAV